MKEVCVILAGCGFLDGSDVRESVLVSYFLQEQGYRVTFSAVDINQKEVIDHKTQETLSQKRHLLNECARINGEVTEIKEVQGDRISALIIPGGEGLLKNLTDADKEGNLFKVNPQVKKLIREIFRRKKPIGGCGLASLLIAGSLSDLVESPLTLTTGNDAKVIQKLENLGINHVVAKPSEAVIDEEHRIVTTPGHLNKIRTKDVAPGIKNMISGIVELTQKTSEEL
jgi:enhancing lycopene biosynthesis protein 2